MLAWWRSSASTFLRRHLLEKGLCSFSHGYVDKSIFIQHYQQSETGQDCKLLSVLACGVAGNFTLLPSGDMADLAAHCESTSCSPQKVINLALWVWIFFFCVSKLQHISWFWIHNSPLQKTLSTGTMLIALYIELLYSCCLGTLLFGGSHQ